MNKITVSEWVTFNAAYIHNKYQGKGVLRFGQEFMNTLFPEVVDPELFYEKDLNKAVSYAYSNYVNHKVIGANETKNHK